MDERVQVNGMHVLVDCSTASLDTAKLANPSVYRRLLNLVEVGFFLTLTDFIFQLRKYPCNITHDI